MTLRFNLICHRAPPHDERGAKAGHGFEVHLKRNCSLCLFLLVALIPLVSAKDEQQLPNLVVHAPYVLVTTYYGDDVANPRMMPDDRQAMIDVQNAIRQWGRYVLVYNRKDADLILLVRKGRIVESLSGVQIHAGSDTKPGLGPDIVGDAGDPQDMLTLYNAAQGINSPPLWRGRQPDGLNPPQMELVKQLRSAVEAAAQRN